MLPKFEASDPIWTAGWEWAVAQAMAYVFSGDPVGDWIEARPDLTWHACFDLQTPHLVVDGARHAATVDRDLYGQPRSWVAIPVPAGTTRTVRIS